MSTVSSNQNFDITVKRVCLCELDSDFDQHTCTTHDKTLTDLGDHEMDLSPEEELEQFRASLEIIYAEPIDYEEVTAHTE